MNPSTFRHHSLWLKSILIVANNEWRAFTTNKGVLVSMLMQPVMMYGLLVLALSTNISSVKYAGHVIPYNQYALIGILAFFMTTQMSQAMYRATVDKQYGLLAIKFLNGVQPWQYLCGMSLFPSLGFIFQSIILFILGILSSGIYNVVYYFIALVFALIILEFWSSLGILISTKISSYQKRDLIITLVFIPVSYAAPTLYVLPHHAPLLLKMLTSINPLTYQLNAIRSIAYGNFNITSIGIGVLITIVMIVATQIILNRMQLTLSER